MTSHDRLQGLSAAVSQARVLVGSLRLVPDDPEGRVELVRLTGALVGHADREGWYALGDVAGPLVRLLATRRSDDPVLDALAAGFDEIERLIDERMALA